MPKIILRFIHFLFGHPGKKIIWGDFLNGAECECGVKFHLWDLYP